MKPKLRLILPVLIVLILGAAPSVHAFDPNSVVSTTVTCADPPTSWNGEITSADQVDYYAIDLVAGQVLTIDVDAEDLSSLDSLLEVFDSAGNLIGASDDDRPPGEDSLVDPYLEITVDLDDTYYLAISASSKNEGEEEAGSTGSYMLFLQCSDPSIPPATVEPVKVGDLLGATGLEPGSLLDIIPEDATSTNRFPLSFGPVSDIEFDPVSGILFAATHAETGSLYAIDPDTGDEIKGVELNSGSIIALEAAEGTLYGVRLEVDPSDNESFKLITIDKENLGIITEVTLSDSLRALAYHPVDKVMYGASGTDLVKINLTSLPGEVQPVGSTGLGQAIVALDFSNDNLLYAVDIPGNLYTIPYLNLDTEQPVNIGTVSAVNELPYVPKGPYSAAINGLTFVVGEAPPNEEPIKTICSSTLTSPMTAISETKAPKPSRLNNRLKLKHNPLHRAVGLFKFKGRAGETVTLKLAPEVEEPAVAGEEYAVRAPFDSRLKCKGKGRVFLGVRDAIPHVSFRVRKKDQMPFEISAVLPADGSYYVMVIRPLARFYRTDYCLTLESDHPDSEAWQTLDVVWPGADSEKEAATVSAEGKVAEPVSVAPDSSRVEPVDQGRGQELQPVEETTVDDTGEVAPSEEPAAEATEESAVKGAPAIPEDTTVDDTAK